MGSGIDPNDSLGDILETVFAALDVGLLVFDSSGRIVRHNRQAGRLISVGDNLVEMLRHAAFDGPAIDWQSVLAEVLRGGGPRHFDALSQRLGDGSERFFRILVAPLTDSGAAAGVHSGRAGVPPAGTGITLTPTLSLEGRGSPTGSAGVPPARAGGTLATAPQAPAPVALSLQGQAGANHGLLIIEDVSRRVGIEQRLAVSERLAALGQLAARVAHELNNPLDGILRYVNLARRVAEPHENEKLDEYLEHATGGLMRLAQIVRSLLEFSRGGYSGPTDSTVRRLIDEAVRVFERPAMQASVSIVCSFQSDDLPLTRSTNLFQVFCNVIKNAIDAMSDGGTLTIRTRAVGGELLVSFEDTGPGLPADAERIFEPFFTTKPPGKGTGLGLAVCRELIQKYGGRIEAANRPGCGGAVFTVRLPMAPAAETH